MKRLSVILYILLCNINIFSQNLIGRIIDTNGVAINEVNIYSSNGRRCVTNINGVFKLNLPTGSNQLFFHHINFNQQMIEINILEDEKKKIDVTLEHNIRMLNDVEILNQKKERIITDVLSVKIIESDRFEKKINKDFSDIVNNLSSVTLTDRQISIRGGSGWNAMAGSRVLVLIDNIPLLSGDLSQIPWDLIPIENIEQIEITKGASSAIYGSSSMNGVINIKTKSTNKGLIDKHPFPGYTQFNSTYGIYDNPRNINLKWWNGKRQFHNTDILYSDMIGNTSLTLGINHFHDEGYRFLEENKRNRLSLNLLRNHQKREEIIYGIRGTIMEQNIGRFLFWESYQEGYIPADNNVYQTNSLLFHIDPFISYNTNNGKHLINSRYLKISLDNNTNQVEAEKSLYSTTYYLDYKYKGWIELLSANIVLGTTASYISSYSDIFNGENESNTNAIYSFIEEERNNTTLSLGGRYELIRIRSEEKFSFDNNQETNNFKIGYPLFYAGILHKINNKHSFRAYLGQGIRFPSIAEMSSSTNVHGGTYIYPNLSLKPESGWSYELAYHKTGKIKNLDIDFDIAYFIMQYDNMMEISFAQWGDQYDIEHAYGLGFKTVNVGKTQINGTEVEIDAYCDINKDWKAKLSVGYTYMDPTSLTPESVYAETDNLGISEPITYNNSSSDTTILKYRYQHLLKIDTELAYKKINLGIDIKYNDYMRNIDSLFVTDLVNIGVPELDQPPAFPGIIESREVNKQGDLMIDLSIGLKISSIAKLTFVINNATNNEIHSRPMNILPPRTYSLKLNVTI